MINNTHPFIHIVHLIIRVLNVMDVFIHAPTKQLFTNSNYSVLVYSLKIFLTMGRCDAIIIGIGY